MLPKLVTMLMLAQAQPLGDFLKEADQLNFDSRTAIENRTKAEAEFGQAWGALLPSLTANGGYTHNQYAAVISLGAGQTVTITPADQLDATLKAEMPLIDAAKWLKTAATSSSAEAARQKQSVTRDTVHRQVASAFYSYLGARAVLESANRSLAAAISSRDVMVQRAAAGVANELEAVRAQAEVERNEQLVADAESLLEIGGRTLQTLSGLAPREMPSLPIDDLHAPPALDTLEVSVNALPSVRAAEADVEAANRTSTAAALALIPSVNAQFTQRFTNATGFQNANSLYNAGVTFAWKLDAPAVQAMRAQRSAQETALIAAQRARTAAADQLHSDWFKLKASLKKVASARAQIVSARRAATLAHERNAAGVATQLDVITAERDLFTAEISGVQASAELASARAALQISSGEGVTP